jgi:hypothetical protein
LRIIIPQKQRKQKMGAKAKSGIEPLSQNLQFRVINRYTIWPKKLQEARASEQILGKARERG